MQKFLRWLAALVFSQLVFQSLAWSQGLQTSLTADILVKKPNGVLVAKGNAILRQGLIEVEANSIEINPASSQVIIQEISQFNFGEKIRLSAAKAEFDFEQGSGTISSSEAILDNLVTINANELVFNNNQLTRAEGIWRVTSCRVCDEKDPFWYFTASNAERDNENQDQVYRNVMLHFKGTPIAFLPYLRLPDPSVRRKQGFLSPSLELTSNFGSGLKLPYFIPIDRSKDVLLTPYISPKTKTLEYRYRQVVSSGDLVIDGALSNDIFEDKIRGYVRGQGSFNLNLGLQLELDGGHVSDKAYLGDYLYHDFSDFDTSLVLSKTSVSGSSFLDSRVTYTRDVGHETDVNKYLSTSLNYNRVLQPEFLEGLLVLDTQLSSSINFDSDNNFSRPPSFSTIGLKYSRLKNFGPIIAYGTGFGKLKSFVNSGNEASLDEEITFATGTGLLLSIPLRKSSEKRSQILTPKVKLSYVEQNSDVDGDHFIGLDELSKGNIFFGNKIVSVSESEIGFGVSSGLEYKSAWHSGHKFEGFLGVSRIQNASYETDYRSGLKLGRNNYLIDFSYSSPEHINLYGLALFAADGNLAKSNLRTDFSLNNFMFSTNYEQLVKSTVTKGSEDIENINISSSFLPVEGTELITSGRFDAKLERMAEASIGFNTSVGRWDYNFGQTFLKDKRDKLMLSAAYDDECTSIIFSFENRSQRLGTSSPIRTLGFKVTFKQFTDFKISR